MRHNHLPKRWLSQYFSLIRTWFTKRRFYGTLKCSHFQLLVCALFSAFRRARHIILHSCHSRGGPMSCMHARAPRTLDKTQPPKELQSFPSLPQILSQEGTTPPPPFSSSLHRAKLPLRFVVCFAMQTRRGRMSPNDWRQRRKSVRRTLNKFLPLDEQI